MVHILSINRDLSKPVGFELTMYVMPQGEYGVFLSGIYLGVK